MGHLLQFLEWALVARPGRLSIGEKICRAPGSASEPEKRLSDDELMAKIDKTPPEVFPSVVCAKLDAGTVTATCFNLINQDRQRLATLTTTDDRSEERRVGKEC